MGVDQLAVGLLEIVCCTEALDRVLGVEHALSERGELAVHQRAHPLSGRGLVVRLIGEIGLGDGLGEPRRLGGVLGGDVDLDDEGLVVARDLHVLDEGGQRALLGVVALGGRSARQEPGERLPQAEHGIGRARSAEFGVGGKMLRPDHRPEHGV